MIANEVGTGTLVPQSVSSVQIYTSGDKLVISNVKSDTRIDIYGLDGILVQSRKTNVDTIITLNKGVWIVKALAVDGNKVAKMLTK